MIPLSPVTSISLSFSAGLSGSQQKFETLSTRYGASTPFGAFLCWEPPQDYAQPKTAHSSESAKLWIVDGQQRATAACLIVGRKPYWWPDAARWNDECKRCDVLVDIEAPLEDLDFNLPNPVRRNQPEWVSVRDIINAEDSTSFALKIMKNLGVRETDMTRFRDIHAKVDSIRQIASQRHVFIVIVDKEPEDVAEIFGRLNLAGTKVKEADVALALLAGKQPGWVREQFDPFVRDLEHSGFDLEPSVLVRTLVGFARTTSRLKKVPKGFWSDKKIIGDAWSRVKEAVGGTIKHLNDYGILTSNLLVSTNALIPLFNLYDRYKASGYEFRRSFAWFLHANWHGRYSGSAITVVEKDLRTLKNANSFGSALAGLLKEVGSGNRRVEDTGLLADYRHDKFLRMLLYLVVFDRKAEGWVAGTRMRIGFANGGNELNRGFEPEWHHFFPRSVLKKAAVRDDDANAVANITVLPQKANQRIRQMPPTEYIKRFEITDTCLEQQCVPRDSSLWDVPRYQDFLCARAELLSQAMNDYLNRLAHVES